MTNQIDRLSLRVALLPSVVREVEPNVCIVIDVLRAATTLAYMARTGVRQVIVTPDPPSARAAALELGSDTFVGGESHGLKPDDFDFGNSPSDYADPSLAGRSIVFCSSNGARALHLIAAAPILLAGAVVNARATARLALEAARARRIGITIVCSGEGHGTAVDLEDTFGAGLIVDHLLQLAGSDGVELDDAAILARRLFESYLSTDDSSDRRVALGAKRMLSECESARFLRGLGLGDDVNAVAEADSIDAVMIFKCVDGRLAGRPSP